jgi:hypothetical protein
MAPRPKVACAAQLAQAKPAYRPEPTVGRDLAGAAQSVAAPAHGVRRLGTTRAARGCARVRRRRVERVAWRGCRRPDAGSVFTERFTEDGRIRRATSRDLTRTETGQRGGGSEPHR